MLTTDTYSDDKYLIMNGTLVFLKKENSDTLVIPPEVNGHRIVRIGGGVFAGDAVKTIMISEGIEEIGAMSFANSRNLEKVILPESLKKIVSGSFNTLGDKKQNPPSILLKRSLNKDDFDIIQNNSIPLADGRRLLTSGYASLEGFVDICSGLGHYNIPRTISREMGALYLTTDTEAYISNELKSSVGDGTFEELPFEGTPYIRKIEADWNKDFREMYVNMLLKSDHKGYTDRNSEDAFERALRIEGRRKPDEIVLAVYDEKAALENNGRISVTVRLMLGYAFFGELTKVIYQGKDYYIYREKHLNPVIYDYDYLTYVHQKYIVDAEGNRPSRDISNMVAVKYRLPLMFC